MESLKVIQSRWGVGDGPHTEIVHVRHHAPGVLEGDLLAWLQEAVHIGRLAVVARETQGVTEGLPGRLQVCQLVHYYFLFIIILV